MSFPQEAGSPATAMSRTSSRSNSTLYKVGAANALRGSPDICSISLAARLCGQIFREEGRSGLPSLHSQASVAFHVVLGPKLPSTLLTAQGPDRSIGNRRQMWRDLLGMLFLRGITARSTLHQDLCILCRSSRISDPKDRHTLFKNDRDIATYTFLPSIACSDMEIAGAASRDDQSSSRWLSARTGLKCRGWMCFKHVYL